MQRGLGSQSLLSVLAGIALLCLILASWHWPFFSPQPPLSFVRRNGTHFVVDSKPFYINGWNSYWLMAQSMDYNSRSSVRQLMKKAAEMGLSVCRTWAFYDGGQDALQQHPGHYNENVFKTILSRVNSISGVVYRDEPAIFAWELINEPRCASDPSSDTLQAWIEEMAQYVKSIDRKHLLTVGLEGFYGPSTPEKLKENPGDWAESLGSDFLRHSKLDLIDFASVHAYPDTWTPHLGYQDKLKFLEKWVASHVEDGSQVLKKPVLFTEFGLSTHSHGFEVTHREKLLKIMYDKIYDSAYNHGAGAGALVWQFSVEGSECFDDDFSIIPWQQPSLYKLFIEQSCRLQGRADSYRDGKQVPFQACLDLNR